jgi:methylated-DNA-protein-cysteine methyltransferase-like protein
MIRCGERPGGYADRHSAARDEPWTARDEPWTARDEPSTARDVPVTPACRLRHNDAMPGRRGEGTYGRIYSVVQRIPRGRVATYGQVAELAGLPRQPRQVGYALHALDDESDVPWHRVINARGQVSPRAAPGWDQVQRQMLEHEGVTFDPSGRVSLERYRWRPRARSASRSC